MLAGNEKAMEKIMTASKTGFAATKVIARDNGHYLWLDDTGTEHGPFATVADALDGAKRETRAAGKPDDWLAEIGYEAAFPLSFGL